MCPFEQKQWVIGRMFFDICNGLYYLHAWNVAHFDIKPNNIVISTKNGGKAMIIDFNTVEQYDNTSCFNSVDVMGTEIFSPPEARFTPDCKAEQYDMWSLGATLYNLYYGKMAADENFKENSKIKFPEASPAI